MKSPVRSFRCAAIAVALVSFSITAKGQTPTPSPGASSTPVKTDASTPKEDQGKQKSNTAGQIANETRNAVPGSSPKVSRMVRIRPGDELSVEVGDLKDRVERQPDLLKTTRLFLDCKLVEDVESVLCLAEKKVVFTLNRKAMEQITEGTRIVSVGISFTDPNNAELVMPEKVQLVLMPLNWWLLVALAIVVAMLIVLYVYGRYSNLLRDGQAPGSADSNPASGPVIGGTRPPALLRIFPGLNKVTGRPLALYSLAKVQMAWWLFIIVAAFLGIWVAVGDYNTVTTSTLILFGISVGTTVTSKIIDTNKQSNAQDLKATKAALEQQVAPSAPAEGAAATEPAPVEAQTQRAMKAVQLEQVKAQLTNLTVRPEEATSQGFLTDIMSDENGVSVHRFQMVVWTIVLTLIFVSEVYKTLSMPEFSNTLLTLMGISSGTYVTLKVPEKHSVVSR